MSGLRIWFFSVADSGLSSWHSAAAGGKAMMTVSFVGVARIMTNLGAENAWELGPNTHGQNGRESAPAPLLRLHG